MKLTPRSRHVSIIDAAVRSSTCLPKVIVPSAMRETLRVVWPRVRVCMGNLLLVPRRTLACSKVTRRVRGFESRFRRCEFGRITAPEGRRSATDGIRFVNPFHGDYKSTTFPMNSAPPLPPLRGYGHFCVAFQGLAPLAKFCRCSAARRLSLTDFAEQLLVHLFVFVRQLGRSPWLPFGPTLFA